MKNSLSFVIPSYNSFRTIDGTVQSILGQTCPDCIKEIIVVDSSEDTRTREVLSAMRHPLVKVLLLDRKTSPAIGKNIGVQHATGEILCFIDSDTELSDHWAENISESFSRGCRVGGGSITVPAFQKNKAIVWAQYFLQVNEFMDASKRRRVSFVPGCNLFCDRKLFDEIKGFPEIRAAEDVLFGLSASERTDVWFLPEAKVSHVFREDLKGLLANQILLGKYVFLYRRKHFPNVFYYQELWPLLFMPVFLIAKFLKISGRIIRSNPDYFLKYLLVLPLFLLGLFFWGLGFAKGILSDEK